MQLTFKTMGKELRASQRRPKPNSPHYCTDQRPCEQITHSTQRVQSSPFNNKRTLEPKQVTDFTPRASQVITHTPQVDPGVPVAPCLLAGGSPLYIGWAAKSTGKSSSISRCRFRSMSSSISGARFPGSTPGTDATQ